MDDFRPLRDYTSRTRASVYSLALVAPFLLVYEVGLIALRLTSADFQARNGADAILRYLLFPLGIQRMGALGALIWSALCVLALAACYFWQRSREGPERPRLDGRYAACAFMESAGWGLALFVVAAAIFARVFAADGGRAAADAGGWPLAAEIVFNAGAGVYEEFVFRLALVALIASLLRQLVFLDRTPAFAAAVIVSAVIFSLVHFGHGQGANSWDGPLFWELFAFRAGAALFFSALVHFRGFGVAVAAHAMYDNFVTLLS